MQSFGNPLKGVEAWKKLAAFDIGDGLRRAFNHLRERFLRYILRVTQVP